MKHELLSYCFVEHHVQSGKIWVATPDCRVIYIQKVRHECCQCGADHKLGTKSDTAVCA
jgi:hypothetical protein